MTAMSTVGDGDCNAESTPLKFITYWVQSTVVFCHQVELKPKP